MTNESQNKEVNLKNDILSVLMDMRNGAVANDISTKFDTVVQAVRETGGKGEVTIKL